MIRSTPQDVHDGTNGLVHPKLLVSWSWLLQTGKTHR